MIIHSNSVVRIIHSLVFGIILINSCSLVNNRESFQVKNVLSNIDGEPVIPREANKISIPFFYNHTEKPSISEKLTLKVRRFINIDGRLAVVSDTSNADLRLLGMIVKYKIQPVQYGAFGEPIRKRLRILTSVRLYDIKREAEIFFENEIQSFEIFSDALTPITSEIHVQDRVLENLARRISVKVIDGWYTKLLTPIEKGK